MAVIKWKPFSFDTLEHELERLAWPHAPHVPLRELTTDVSEDDNNLYIEVHAPGINPKTIEAEVRNNHLYLLAEREDKKECEGKNFYKKEIRRGIFERAVPLPVEVDETKIVAQSEHGVLYITLPKRNAHSKESKKINIVQK